jgi:glyoxalase/bleomycin resistance protein/dioxygenase superfamily protein
VRRAIANALPNAQQGLYRKGPWYVERAMIRQIAPQFFTTEMAATLLYYKDRLGFECVGTWGDPPVYAIVARDAHRIHFRLADPPRPNPDKYGDELLDAYLFIQDADALYAEYLAREVEFTRAVGDTAWHSREFVVKDCDGRLLAFGADRD